MSGELSEKKRERLKKAYGRLEWKALNEQYYGTDQYYREMRELRESILFEDFYRKEAERERRRKYGY